LHRRRFLVLAAVALTLSAAAGFTASAQAANGALTGAGSTLVAPLMAKWSQDFQSRSDVAVTYGAVGSGAGIAQISARTVDFGASDAPLSRDQATACNGCVQIPWALSATGIAYHINGVRNLKLTPNVIAQIYLGHIKKWNDRRIASLNRRANLPDLNITPAFRSDGSGDTYAFTDWLTRTSPAWKRCIGFSTQVSFPTGVGGKGNDGISAVVSSTNGAIGYISVSYIIAHNLAPAALQNRAGRFEFPNLRNIAAAAKAVRSVPASNELHIVDPSRRYRTAYPLSTFTYVIVPKSTPKKDLLTQFISYAMNQGQRFGAALDFAPVPSVVLRAGRRTLGQLQQAT
jgi:phosphate transport system substrate-binding protein